MCHKQGNPVIKIKSESTIKISAETFCPSVRKLAEGGGDNADKTSSEDANSAAVTVTHS